MNEYDDDDESTDEEFGVNLQLTERLRLNRGECSSQDKKFENSKEFKQYCNMRKKELSGHGNGASSSSSYEAYNDYSIPEIPSPYMLPNKKRQNMDKSQELMANPKRTCLSDRFTRPTNSKGHSEGHAENQYPFRVAEPVFPYGEVYRTEKNLSPDETYEHRANLPISDDSDSDIQPRFCNNIAMKKAEPVKNPISSLPSSSGNRMNPFSSKFTLRRGVQFVESDSDESSKSPVQNGTLKGGRQSPDYIQYTKKVIGRRNKKVLDSDDTDDEKWHVKYRNRPIYFSSSDSDDLPSESLASERKITLPEVSSPNRSFPCISKAASAYPDQCPSSLQTVQPPGFNYGGVAQMPPLPTSSCRYQTNNVHSPDVDRTYNVHRNPCRGVAFPNFANPDVNFTSPRSSSSSNRCGRSHRKRGVRSSHRSGSPHPQGTLNRCPAEMSRSAIGHRTRSKCMEDKRRDLNNYAANMFDADDSSEVEFFTANSYSDTETSNESLNRPTINNIRINDLPISPICDHSANIGTSEDEISVIYSSASRPCSGEQRNSSGTRGRRFARGLTRSRIQNAPDIVSLSPDPVEQVRQMEEDERYARMLQAQFDAEVDPDFTPSSAITGLPFQHPLDGVDDVHEIDPVGESDSDRFTPFPPSSADSDDEVIDPVGDSDSVRFTPPTLSVPTSPFPGMRRTGGIMNVYSRGRMQSFAPRLFVFNNRRPRSRSRNRRRYSSVQHDPWMWQFTRILGFSQTLSSNLDSLENEYETLLELAEANGDAVQRGLQKAEINRLPTRKYLPPNAARSSNGDVEVMHKRAELNKECQVCLDDYKSGDVLRILPCFHEFHTPCIDPWLKINHTCPVCRVIVDLGE